MNEEDNPSKSELIISRNHSLTIKKSDLVRRGLELFYEINNIQSDNISSIQPRLLLVDDDETLISHCSNYFRNEGYDTHTALNSEEALEFLSKKSVDAVITGIVMPGMDGLELTKIIKEKYDTEVIILTGGGSTDGNKEEARRLGASDFITKPCRLTYLLWSVKKVFVKELIYKGKKKGYLSYNEINKMLPEELQSPEQIDEALTMFYDNGIEIVNSPEEFEEVKIINPAIRNFSANDQAILKHLIRIGKKRSYVTYQELNDIFASENMDKLIEMFDKLDIRIIQEES